MQKRRAFSCGRCLACCGRRRCPRFRERLALLNWATLAARPRLLLRPLAHRGARSVVPAILLLARMAHGCRGRLAHVAGHFRGRLDRAVHRPRHRRANGPSFFKDVQFLLIGPLWLVAAGVPALRASGGALRCPDSSGPPRGPPAPLAAPRTAAATRSWTPLSSGSGTSSSGRASCAMASAAAINI